MTPTNHETLKTSGAPIKAWVRGVAFEPEARAQLERIATLPFIHHHVAVMPDVHAGKGATVGTVIATRGAIIPAAVGVDIGCGMMAVRTSLLAKDLPDSPATLRAAIERAVPHGRSENGGKGDRGAWGNPPNAVLTAWRVMRDRYESLVARHPKIVRNGDTRAVTQLCSLGTGNHFIEVCLDEHDRVWAMLHSGSRGIGNTFGTYFIARAREEMVRQRVYLEDRDLAYFTDGTAWFTDYCEAVEWAQDYARANRDLMMDRVLAALREHEGIPPFQARLEAVNCHHNYVSRERHFGEDVLVTRKGAVRASAGMAGIIPGSMGARSYIVRGRGNADSFESCSHGAGRVMSRTAARARFTLADHVAATEGIECRKDEDVIDETPGAYKSIDAVMAAQSDLVEITQTLRQVICVKG